MTSLTLRRTKGAPLTSAEVDANFEALRSAIDGLEAGTVITRFEQDAEQRLTFFLSDGSTVGPITLPTRTLRIREEWQSGLIYLTGDVIPYRMSSYVAVSDHQATDHAGDLSSGKLRLLAAKGEAVGIGEAPDDGKSYLRRSKAWSEAPAPGIAEAPDDGKSYLRKSKAWSEAPAPGIGDAPKDGKSYLRKDQAWVEAPAATGGSTGTGGGTGGAGSTGGMFRWRGNMDVLLPKLISGEAESIKRFDVVEKDGLWYTAVVDMQQIMFTPGLASGPDEQMSEHFWAPLTFPLRSAGQASHSLLHKVSDEQTTTIGAVLDDLLKRVKDLEPAT